MQSTIYDLYKTKEAHSFDNYFASTPIDNQKHMIHEGWDGNQFSKLRIVSNNSHSQFISNIEADGYEYDSPVAISNTGNVLPVINVGSKPSETKMHIKQSPTQKVTLEWFFNFEETDNEDEGFKRILINLITMAQENAQMGRKVIDFEQNGCFAINFNSDATIQWSESQNNAMHTITSEYQYEITVGQKKHLIL